MIASLPDLIAPLAPSDFTAILHERKPVLQRGSDANRFRSLLEWQTLRGMIETGAITPKDLRLTWNTHNLKQVFYTTDGKVDPAKFAALLARGVSLITKPLGEKLPAVHALCGEMASRLGDPVNAHVVMTVGKGGALKIHYDNPHVVALQVEGSKRWRLYGPPVKDPVKGMPKQTPPEGEPVLDVTLNAGDLLILPAGYWHHCDNGPDLSLHIALVVYPRTGWHAMQSLLTEMSADELMRVPLSRLDDEASRVAHERAVKARMIEAIEKASLADLAAAGRAGAPDTEAEDEAD